MSRTVDPLCTTQGGTAAEKGTKRAIKEAMSNELRVVRDENMKNLRESLKNTV